MGSSVLRHSARWCAPLVASLIWGVSASGAPTTEAYPVEGPDDTVCVGASALSGWFATGDSFEDRVEVRDVNRTLVRTITRADIEALAPWLDLGSNPDGPAALAFSDSGRLLFILVFDATTPGDGQGSDVILKYNTFDDALTLFARLDYSGDENTWAHGAMVHFKGRLHVGTPSGSLLTYRAERNTTSGTLLATSIVPGGAPVTGLGVDRVEQLLYAGAGATLHRASINTTPMNFTGVGSLPSDVLALAHAPHYGGAGQAGLYALRVGAGSIIQHIPDDQARGQAPFAPNASYLVGASGWHDLASTAEGALLVGGDEDAAEITDDTDTRLPFEEFLLDEFNEVAAFARGLISPDGEPAGWVIDADVIPAWSRFHPATPDGACWVVLILLMDDHINGAPDAQQLVRTILTRYAGLAPDGIGPARSPDGFFKHWIDPSTGGTKPGWSTELATYSTMKIVLAADRAAAYYPGDAEIQEAAREIICGMSNLDAYIQSGTDAVHLIASNTGGPQFDPRNFPFTEGIIYVEQAATFGGASSVDSFARWLDRSNWPSAAFVTGKAMTSAGWGQYLPAFLSLYSFLTQPDFRSDPTWRAHVSAILESHGAWTDDAGADFFTVFSAGTTKSEWGGYNADSLGGHPGDLTTFPSLMAMAGAGDTNPAVSAYQAYRSGARQTFKSGASILYRRSDIDPAYDPNSAGLPDVGLGALGLAELIAPGSVDGVLAIAYDDEICAPPPPPCPGDIDGDDDTDVFDFSLISSQFGRDDLPPGTFGDYDFNGIIDVFDFAVFVGDFGCGGE